MAHQANAPEADLTSSPHDYFWRKREAEAAGDGGQNFSCPYCNELAPPGTSKTVFSKRKYLYEHLDRSTSQVIELRGSLADWQKGDDFAAKHDALKAQDGWNDDDWRGDVEHRAANAKKDVRRRRETLEGHIKYVDVEELLEPVPSKSSPFLQHGHRPGELQAAVDAHVAAGWLKPVDDLESYSATEETKGGVIKLNREPFAQNEHNASVEKEMRTYMDRHAEFLRSVSSEDESTPEMIERGKKSSGRSGKKSG